ncbi:MAG: hypothetical protein KKA32_12595 [Actinobacteria bacterium]|nr:hypothetical protein [Actinomycetota bacterium]
MRVTWKGAVSFGLVTIPVKVFGATEARSVGFHQLHDEDFGRIQYRRFCSVCEKEVSYEHIVRGHEHEKESYVVVADVERIRDARPARRSRSAVGAPPDIAGHGAPSSLRRPGASGARWLRRRLRCDAVTRRSPTRRR